MHSIWYSLAWKEWHEHKWKLAAITAVLCGVGAILLWTAEIDAIALAIMFVTMCIIPLAVFVGLGAAASERSRNTLPFLQSLPMPMWPAALTKLVFGLVTLLTSIILTIGFLYICRFGLGFVGVDYTAAIHVFERNSFTGRWYADCLLLCSTVAASFFIWAAAAGVNRKDEVSAGAVALAVMACWYLLLVATSYLWFFPNAVPDWFVVTAVATAPAGFLTLLEPQLLLFLSIGVLIAISTHLALVAWYVRQFGRVANVEIHSYPAALRCDTYPGWLASPRRSVFTAIAWKQFRESVPLVFVGLAGVIGVTTLILMNDPYVYFFQYDRLAEMVAGVLVVVSFFVAIVVGIGVCLNDASPGLNTFWRSRPINPDVWFWTKFGTGIAVLLATMYGPLLAIVLTLHRDPSRFLLDSESVLHAVSPCLVFAAAVMTTCLVRHAIYAAILSFAVMYLGLLTGVGIWFVAELLHMVPLGTGRWWEPTEAQVAFGMALTLIANTLIAWLAVRYDWGRKSRY